MPLNLPGITRFSLSDDTFVGNYSRFTLSFIFAYILQRALG